MAVNYNPKIVTDGLVLYLDAGNTKSYPGTGTVWTDLSPSSKNATTVNSPTFSNSNGGIFTLNGLNQRIALQAQSSSTSPLSGYGSFTGGDNSAFSLEVWIKSRQIAGSNTFDAPAIIGWNDGGIWANLNLYNGYVYYVHYDNAWINNIKSTTLVSNNVWHHVVYVNNTNKTGVLYIDSVNEANGSSTLSPLSGTTYYFVPAYLGSGYSDKWLNASIAAVRFYDKSLSATEVRQNFNATRGRFGI